MALMSSMELITPWRLLRSLRKTPIILQTLLRSVTASQAQQTHKDDAWSIIDVLCHLRDYESIFLNRATLILAEECPQLPTPEESNEELARKGAYKQQDITAVLASLFTTRQTFLQTLSDLSEEQWMRTGIHGGKISITLKEAVLQVIMHDIDHIEQITQLLNEEVQM